MLMMARLLLFVCLTSLIASPVLTPCARPRHALVRMTIMMDTGSSGIETASCNGVIPGTSGIDAASGNGVIHVTGPIAVHRAITTIAVSAAKSGSKRPGRVVASAIAIAVRRVAVAGGAIAISWVAVAAAIAIAVRRVTVAVAAVV